MGSSSTMSAVDPLGLEVQHVGDAAGHAGREVAPGRPEDDGLAAGHVLAPVVAHALDDGGGAGVADAEPLAHHAPDERLAGGRAVEADVAGDDLAVEQVARRGDRDPAARQALADVVVGVAGQLQRDPLRHERAEGVARRTGEADVDRVLGRPAPPHFLVTWWPSIVPTVRLTLRIGSSSVTCWPNSIAPSASWISVLSSACARPWSCSTICRRGCPRAGRAGRGSATGPGPGPSSGSRRPRCRAVRCGR